MQVQKHSTPGWLRAALVLVAFSPCSCRPSPPRSGPARWPPPVVVEDIDTVSKPFRDLVMRFVERVREKPADASRHAQLGLVYEANNRFPAAKACYQNALQLRVRDPLLLYHDAIVTERLGENAAAMELLDKLVEEFPAFAPGQHRRAVGLLEAGRLDEAAEGFRRVVALEPGALAGSAGLAQVLLRKKDFAGAAAILEPLMPANSQVRMPHYLLGLAYRGMEKTADAERELALGTGARRVLLVDEWTRQFPRYDAAPSIRARLDEARQYLDSGAVKQGVEMLRYALEWHPDDADILVELGLALLRLDQPEEAGSFLLKAESLSPGRADVTHGLAELYLKRQQLPQALTQAERAIEIEPNACSHRLLKGKILLTQKQVPEAYAALSEAVALDQTNAEAWMGKGTTAMLLGELDEARASFARLVELQPGSAQGYIGLCHLSLKQGETTQAAEYLRAAQERQPDNPQVLALIRQMQAGSQPSP